MVACHCGGAEDGGSLSRLSSPARVPVKAGVTPAVHLHGAARLATPSSQSASARLARVVGVPSETEVAVHAVMAVLPHWGPPCSDDPVSTLR